MNFSVKLPVSSVVGEFDTAISSYLMDTVLLAAKPQPVNVTSAPISGCSG